MRPFSEELTLKFIECASLTGDIEGARNAIRLLQSSGGQFLTWRRNVQAWETESNPLKFMDAGGGFAADYFAHSELKRNQAEHAGLHLFAPTAALSFLPAAHSIWVGQDALDTTCDNLDELARGQLGFGQVHYSVLRPKMGFTDELSMSGILEKMVQRTELKYLFWSNFYSPTYVEKYGRDFLLNAPGWKKEELDDGGILYVVTESYYDWWTKPPKEVLDYFRSKIPRVKLYRAKQSPDF